MAQAAHPWNDAPAKRRVLVSADAHGGSPPGALARIQATNDWTAELYGPHLKRRLGHGDHGRGLPQARALGEAEARDAASDYVRRQVQVTFQYDPVGVANRHFTGLRCLMWGSDDPHHEGTWPNSQEAVARQFEGVPADEIDQIVRRNAALTFGFDA